MFLPRLLKWEDRNSMAFLVEGRYPFLDHELIERCLSFAPGYFTMRAGRSGRSESDKKHSSKEDSLSTNEPWLRGSPRQMALWAASPRVGEMD
jgi:asparagine synthetase B (glutamine-hydrolysing)